MIKSRVLKWVEHLASMGRKGMHIGFWWVIQKEKDYWEERLRSEDNIKMDLRDIGWGGKDWIELAQERARWSANKEMNLRVP
jgi:hypothetical protein